MHQKNSRAEFIDLLADQLIQSKWKENDPAQEDGDGKAIFESLCDRIPITQDDTSDDTTDDGTDFNFNQGIATSQQTECIPKAVKAFIAAQKSKRKGFGCKICTFEGRP